MENLPIQREIKIFDLTGLNIAQIESGYNNNFGKKGWCFLQYVEINGVKYIIAEREV